MKRKQLSSDRTKRLNEGRCPIHGLWMSQVDGWHYPNNREPYTIVGCPRGDCEARARANDIDGPWEILEECDYLLDQRYLPPLRERTSNSARTVKPKKTDIFAKTQGRCYYCGSTLEFQSTFCVDHIVPQVEKGSGDIENLVPSCRNCNSAKGTKSVEQFRFHRSMQKYRKLNNIWFTYQQVQFLARLDIDLNLPGHTFWFELQPEA